MSRAFVLCLTIVAAFPPLLSAAPAFVMAPVPPVVADTAQGFGLAADRVRYLPELVRLVHAGPENRTAAAETLRRTEAERPASSPVGDAAARVLVPLGAEAWSAAVFKRAVPLEHLLLAILADRNASLLAAGLAALDDETLQYFGDHTALLTLLYELGAPALSAFGGSLRVHEGRIVPPGGAAAAPLWEAVVGAPVTSPDHFIPLLFQTVDGRLAYLYDLVGGLGAPSQAFALGTWLPDPAARVERFKALAAVTEREYREWKPDALPYSRAMNDLTLLLLRLRVDRTGRPAGPARRAFWRDIWDQQPAAAAPSAAGGRDDLVDAAFLAEAATAGNMYERGDRLEQIAFAQRVFRDDPGSPDAAAAVRAFPRVRMLMLTLERMGLRAPALYATVARQAAALEIGDSNRGFWVMAQVQPALALVARGTASGSIDPRTADSLVRSLFAVPVDERGRYAGGIARWLTRELEPRLPTASDVEGRLMLAMAGPSPGASAPRIEWEGGVYRFDLSYAESHRLRAIREKQGGYTVDLALALERVAGLLSRGDMDAEGLAAAQAALAAAMQAHGSAIDQSTADLLPPGVSAPRRARDVLDHVASELAQSARARDFRRPGRQTGPLLDLVDVVLGESLLSLAYAADIGDPAGTALLARNVALRHDFGFGQHDGDTRGRVLWAVPRQDFQPGVPWHVTGSALGLDIALARLSLTRINADRLSGAPRTPSNERDGFAVGLALMNVRRLEDSARDEIAAALARGARRLDGVAAGREGLEAIADRLELDPLRRRSLRLVLEDGPRDRLDAQFTLAEVLVLGQPDPSLDLDAWGANGLQLFGCACTRFVTPSVWRLLAGRPQVAFAAASVPDLNLRVAVGMAELRLPAQLAKAVLSAAVQDFVEDAGPVDGRDWWALSQAARSVPSERIEDYVAAVASIDGALVPDETPQDTP